MKILMFMFAVSLFVKSQAGVTEVPQAKSYDDDDEVEIESVTQETLMPANLFDPSPLSSSEQKPQEDEQPWGGDDNPLFRALRDFIFQGGEDLLDDTTASSIDSTTEELVRILEKGLIEATTMLLQPTDDENFSTSPSVEDMPDPFRLLRIEESDIHKRMGEMAAVDAASSQMAGFSSVVNVTGACTDCYNTLHSCVQQCFTQHNCKSLQRQARMCPETPARLCNFFTNWSPLEECKSDDDCDSPLLCCNDGCMNKCSPGVWRH